MYFREIARLVRGSPGTVQRELAALTQAGVLRSELVGRQRYYSADGECPIFPELRAIVAKTFGIADTLRVALHPQSRKIKIAFVYGSIASETQTGRSDVDVMVVGSVKLRELASALERTEHVLGRPVNPSVFSQKEFVEKIQRKNHFVLSVLASDKIFLIGGPDDIGRLAE